ncbi:HAD hydrolase-like protein [Candidatus Saccharibacteria bacterium]|nr:HAD hydrolase-like protein [Candidatus Saccharibacteria bacterium]
MKVMNVTKTYALDDIQNLDFPRLYESGFKVLSSDLDRTLLGQYDEDIISAREDMFRRIGDTDLEFALVSNAHGERIKRVRRVANIIGEMIGRECICVVPDDVDGRKKPHADMLMFALQSIGIYKPHCALHVGDQIRSDVKAAEAAGFRVAVAVKPMGEGDDPIVRAIGRPLIEPLLRSKHGLPLKLDDFPGSLPDEAYHTDLPVLS